LELDPEKLRQLAAAVSGAAEFPQLMLRYNILQARADKPKKKQPSKPRPTAGLMIQLSTFNDLNSLGVTCNFGWGNAMSITKLLEVTMC